jgi:WD40 repeat protein
MDGDRGIIIECFLDNYFPTDVSKLINDYEHEFEGKWYNFGKHANWVKCIAVITLKRSPTNVPPEKRIISGSDDGTLKIWNLQTRNLDATLINSPFGVFSVIALNNGQIVYGLSNGSLRVCNITFLKGEHNFDECNDENMYELEGHTNGIYSLVSLLDGRIASGSSDNTIRIWNLKTKKCDAILRGSGNDANAIYCINVLANGQIISGSRVGTLEIWNPQENNTYEEKSSKVRLCHASNVIHIGKLSNGSSDCCFAAERIMSAGCDGKLNIWGVQNEKFELDCTFDEFKQCHQYSKCECDGGSHNLISSFVELSKGRILGGTYHGQLKYLRLNDNTIEYINNFGERCNISNGIHCMTAYDNNQIISGSIDGTLKLWY